MDEAKRLIRDYLVTLDTYIEGPPDESTYDEIFARHSQCQGDWMMENLKLSKDEIFGLINSVFNELFPIESSSVLSRYKIVRVGE